MARLTDERISELLPKSLMHETELESLAREVRELRAEVERLSGDLREARVHLSWDTSAAERLTRELAEARELLREFRASRAVGDWENAAEKYDARFGQPQPEPAGELVPWTAETRPRGNIWIRLRNETLREWAVTFWGPDGFEDSEGDINSWWSALSALEWSRDGIAWQRCGVVR